MEQFINLMAEIMEVEPEEIGSGTEFREATEFDSMMGYSMICMVEEEYGKEITVDQFLECKTIHDLYTAATAEGK
ncbi:MAG: acyl carrier protein [Lachnospiraceae bacterium]|nr:acyl carrier protein [Lachnospiraceae bacterium]